jgi:hypothetical protein
MPLWDDRPALAVDKLIVGSFPHSMDAAPAPTAARLMTRR